MHGATIKIIYFFLTAIGFEPGGSSKVHIYLQTIHKTTQRNRIQNTHITIKIHKHAIRIHKHNNKDTLITELNRNTTISK